MSANETEKEIWESMRQGLRKIEKKIWGAQDR